MSNLDEIYIAGRDGTQYWLRANPEMTQGIVSRSKRNWQYQDVRMSPLELEMFRLLKDMLGKQERKSNGE